ncbi:MULTISPECIES: lipopolysaccharide assembly protein LapA domain-containing protein [Pseudomonas]|uniref:Lipopolysaccharide assembly protein LapA domain-containing protein n=1 Tax=Pseudomonas peradeniyensis TaxID=2745488 RepID=A0ABT2V9B9_9PSED|nr:MULTISPECIES: lipopolysaccharide assembly protein LapA domain-containing protein [Pseudomonas]MCU7237895.1 lipopolysaccharide assembly protein LapA domain-containing protein [Pseudomonas peradeniyensis]MCU7279570.1 lipopolysaccharide assembly protein LapA domain-containing protein [Pseudomonas peradeniyensis]QZA53187.1 lipopolysaccharide assembly protein LapA domain-containing protein [Pseudomonas sp. 2hn]
MLKFRRLFSVLLLLLLVLSVVAFVLENQQQVTISILGWSMASIPVALVALSGVVLGLLLGMVLFALHSLATQRKRAARVR